MTIDKDGLAAARDAFEEVAGTVTSELALRRAITAYLSALPNTGDELVARADRARDFPKNTCPASRQVQMIGEALVKGEKYHMIDDEPEYVGSALLSVVASLYEARTSLTRAREDALEEAAEALDTLADAADYAAMNAMSESHIIMYRRDEAALKTAATAISALKEVR